MENEIIIDPELMSKNIKDLIIQLNYRIDNHGIEMKNLIQTRRDLQNICKHQFKPDGRDHVNIYETCTICGFTQKN